MNCHAKILNICRLTQNSYRSILLSFGETDISADSFTLKILDSYSKKLKESVNGEIDLENRVYFPEFTLPISESNYEIIWNHNGKDFLLLTGKYTVTNKPNMCGCSDTSDVINISVNDGDTIVQFDYSEVVIGNSGDVDLSSYSKKDGSNITDVATWQTALDIYTATEAQSKNNAQDSAISTNASAISSLDSQLSNEVEARQNADLDFAQTITELDGIVTTIKNWKEQMTNEDVDSIVNNISEVLAVFQNVPEGANLIDLFNQKLNVDSVVNNLTSTTTNVPLSAYQGRVLSETITSLSNAFNTHTHSWSSITGKPSTFAPPAATSANLGGVYFKSSFDKTSVNPDIVSPKTLYDFLSDPGEYVTTTQTVDLGTLSVGYIKTADGLVDASLTAWRTSDYIPCSANQVYYYSGYAYSSVDATNAAFAYNSAKVYLGIVLLDTTAAVALTDQQFTIPNNPNIAYLRAVYRNNGGDVKVLKRQITIPSPDAKRLPSVTDVMDPNDKVKALSGYAAMHYPLNKSWGAIGHSIWANDDVDGIIGIQSLVKTRVVFSDYAKYAYSGNSLTGSSLTDTNCILRTANTTLWTSKDIYTLDSITNDFKLNRAIGTNADYTGNTGVTTFYGALRVLHDKLKALNPNYRMICTSPLQRNDAGYTSWSTNTLGFTLKDYTDALLWVRNRLSWSFVDQFNDSGINLENLSLFTSDNLHPNNLGYERYYMLWVDAFRKI